jgi:serine protease Do
MKKEMKMNRLTTTLVFGVSGLAAYAASQSIPRTLPEIHRGQESASYRDVAKFVLPAVVSIEATTKPTLAKAHFEPFGQIPGLPDELRKRFEDATPEPEQPGPRHGLGSGFIIDPSGIIVTNTHVVRNAQRVEVVLHDGSRFAAKDIKSDPKTDLAVLRIETGASLPTLRWGDSSEMEIGDRVLAVGAPLGMTGTVTSGIISAKGRDIHMNQYEDFLQTDAAINPGNSGGPLVNLHGEVIGVNSAIKSGTGGFQGIGLAISSRLAQNVVDRLQKDGTVHRGYLGVQVRPLEPDVAKGLGLTGKPGVVVAKVMPDTPAAAAGLEDGDVIIRIAGQSVQDGHDLQMKVANLPLEKSVEITVVRDGAEKELRVAIREQPEQYGVAAAEPGEREPQTANLEAIGAKVTPITPELAKESGLPAKAQGVLVTEVDENGVAARAGLRRGTLIEKIDRHPVHTVDDARAQLQRGSLVSGILVQVSSAQGGTSYVVLKS